MLIVRGLIGGLSQCLMIALFLLVPAGLVPGGSWFWGRGIALVALYALILESTIIIIGLKAPASLEARLKRPEKGKQPEADRIITSIFISVTLLWLIFIPLEVFTLKLLPKPHFSISTLVGGGLFILGFIIISIAIYQNSFAVPYVEDQREERGQTLVDTGLYGIVRHPLYLGIIPWLAGLALFLESYLGLITFIIPFSTLIARIFVEERSLSSSLPGYVDYKKRVKYRLIPFIW